MAHLISDALLQQIHAVIREWMHRNISKYIQPVPQRVPREIVHLAKSDSDISKGATGDMEVYFRDSGGTPQISDPLITLSDVRAEMGAYTATKLAYVKMIGGHWCIINTECAE